MQFAQPIWLIAGLLVLVTLIVLFRRFDLRQRTALADFASSHLLSKLTASFSPGRRRLKRLLFAAAVGCIFVALARPQFGYHWEEEKQRGIDILFAVDTSKSMLTQDATPDRLTRAKLAITDFVNQLQGDRVGLIAFAGDAFLQAPLTLDYDAFEESLNAIDTSTIPRGGTDVASAIREAQAAFGDGTKNRKILVLVTDGEDLEGQGIDAARTAAKDGMTIYTVGVGTSSGGLIPVPGTTGGTDFLRDSSGQFVKSHLDETTLKQIASVTGGVYEPLGQQGEGFLKLYREALASLPKQELASKREKIFDERFQWPLGVGLMLLLASTLIGTRRRSAKLAAPAPRLAKAAAGLAAVIFLGCSSQAQASPQSAEQAYKQGNYHAAEQQYEQASQAAPEVAPLQFNLGAAAYKSGAFDKALPAFQKALGTDQVGVQQQAYYDMGNTQYRVGQKTEKASPQDTIKTWQSAVQSYDDALKLQPNDADAKYNRDFVEKKLEQLQKQNPKNQDKQKQDQNQKQDQKQDQQQQQSGGQSQNQNQNQAQNQKQSGSQNQANNSNGQQKQSQQGQPGQQGNPDKDQGQSGSPKDQAQNGNQPNPGGQPKDQNGNQPQQTAGTQPKENPADSQNPQQGNGADSPVAQGKQDSNGQRGQTIPDKNGAKEQPTGNEAESGTPGELTREEARELLNSLKNNEHAMPATADARNGSSHGQDEQPLKDW